MPETKIIAFLKNKGGVGCTTMAYNLATYFASSGFTVLLMDGDMQGDSTALCGIPHSPGMYNLLIHNLEFDEVWMPVPPARYGSANGMLYVVPSDEPTGMRVSEHMASEFVLTQRLAELYGRFDIVIIDTAPSASDFHAGLYYGSDYLIYPTQCQTEPINALKRSMRYYRAAPATVQNKGDVYDKAKVLGIIPTMYMKRQKLQITLRDWLSRHVDGWGTELFQEISEATAWQQAASQRTPIFNFDRKSKAAREAVKVFKRIEELI